MKLKHQAYKLRMGDYSRKAIVKLAKAFDYYFEAGVSTDLSAYDHIYLHADGRITHDRHENIGSELINIFSAAEDFKNHPYAEISLDDFISLVTDHTEKKLAYFDQLRIQERPYFEIHNETDKKDIRWLEDAPFPKYVVDHERIAEYISLKYPIATNKRSHGIFDGFQEVIEKDSLTKKATEDAKCENLKLLNWVSIVAVRESRFNHEHPPSIPTALQIEVGEQERQAEGSTSDIYRAMFNAFEPDETFSRSKYLNMKVLHQSFLDHLDQDK